VEVPTTPTIEPANGGVQLDVLHSGVTVVPVHSVSGLKLLLLLSVRVKP